MTQLVLKRSGFNSAPSIVDYYYDGRLNGSPVFYKISFLRSDPLTWVYTLCVINKVHKPGLKRVDVLKSRELDKGVFSVFDPDAIPSFFEGRILLSDALINKN